jgi:hypothetical protein
MKYVMIFIFETQTCLTVPAIMLTSIDDTTYEILAYTNFEVYDNCEDSDFPF